MAENRNDHPGPGQEPANNNPNPNPAVPPTATSQPAADPSAKTDWWKVGSLVALVAIICGALGFVVAKSVALQSAKSATATVSAPTVATTLPAPASPTTPSVAKEAGPVTSANAAVVCKDGKPAKAQASGSDARASASCGEKPKEPKPTVAKNPAKAGGSVAVAPSPSTGGSVDVVKRLAEENVNLRSRMGGSPSVAVAGSFAPAPAFAEEGKVYSDGGGNTFERHTGGERLCQFMVNGQIRKEVFVRGSSPQETKQKCDLLAQEFLASMTPTTPATPPAIAVPLGSAGQQSSSVTCQLKFNGKVVEERSVSSDSACRAWTDDEAKKRGWVRAS